MPVGRRFHYQLGGKGFMLSRDESGARAWHRTGRADTPGQRSSTDAQFGMLPDELDHPEVWNDWSGGFGHAYREIGANTYHWSENFDSRWPRQLVHAQEMYLAYWRANGVYTSAEPLALSDSPLIFDPSTGVGMVGTLGQGSVCVISGGWDASQGAHIPYVEYLQPHGITATGFNNFNPVGTGAMNFGPGYGRSAVYGSFQYIGQASGNFWRVPLTTASASALATLPGMGFAVIGDRLWRYHGSPGNPRFVQHCAVPGGASVTLDGPMNPANWTATLSIGNNRTRILDMVDYMGQAVIGCPNGLYVGDQSGTFVNVAGDLASYESDDNCRDLTIHNNEVIFPNVGGVFSYRSSYADAIIRQIWPTVLSNRSPISGIVRATRSFAGWLYAGVYSGTTSYIIAGRESNNGWVWHSLNRLPNGGRINRLHFDSITLGTNYGIKIPTRFWVATDATQANDVEAGLYYQHIPQFNFNPLAVDASYSPYYMGSARIDLGSVDWNAPGTDKIFRTVEIRAENLASSALWCQVFYDIDHSGSFTLLGTSAKSPKDTLYFPSGEGSFLTGQSIELSLRSFTATAAKTPVYRDIIIRGALQPRSVDLITAVTRIADNMQDSNGGQMRSAATMLKELRDFANPDAQGLQAHQLIDLAGATSWVKVLTPIEEHEVYQHGKSNPEIAATVKMAVLVYS